MSDSAAQTDVATDLLSRSGIRDEIAIERARQRRVMGWFVTFFTLILLIAIVLILMAGIVVLRQASQVLDRVDEMRDFVTVNTARIGAMTNRFAEIERVQLSFATKLNAIQTTHEQATQSLTSKLERQERWTQAKEAEDERESRNLDNRLLAMGEELAQTTAGIEAVRRTLDQFVSAEGVIVVPAGSGSDGHEEGHAMANNTRHRDSPSALLDSFSAASIDETFETLKRTIPMPERDETKPLTISVVSFPNGDRYEGEFQNGLMHGWGVYSAKRGDRYEGMFENDLRHGPGTLTTVEGERYTGMFVNGIRQGLGSLTQQDGSHYVGDFRNDMINGRGVILYPDGSKYAGDFMNGRKHGSGVIRFANGDVYDGEFRNDVRTGKGDYLFADGSRYTGDFVDGVRHGQGRYRTTDGAEYIGPFKNGQMHGEGVRIYPDGQRIRGLWHEGKHVRDILE